ncbi:MAG: hypothetical protein NT051_06425, partial [Candidatus Micrarchaeota archaeon]|nr:hypothetical protein [Candidatus Micrarchaeota archaeon]
MDTRHLALSILLFSLLLSSISSAACPTAHRQVKLAAVIGEETGGIFTLLVDVKPGNGTIYTSINPLIGVATQESEQMAVSYAFNSTGINQSECDVFFSMFGDFGGNRVDGPSAGAAMALATRSALLGTPFRQDVVVTGTISPDGKVGAVGGIIEKSTAASDSGARYILVPSLQIYESFLLSTLSANGDFSAVEVQNIPAAERVLTSSQSEKFSLNFSPQSKPIPSSLEELKYDSDTGRFSIVASHMVDALESTKDAL